MPVELLIVSYLEKRIKSVTQQTKGEKYSASSLTKKIQLSSINQLDIIGKFFGLTKHPSM